MGNTNVEASSTCCRTRDVLWHLVFIGFAVNYMIRLNLNIAIVSMIRPKLKDNISVTSECLDDTIPSNNTINAEYEHNYTLPFYLNATALPKLENITSSTEEYFDWDEKEVGYILASFFWVHWITQIPGGILATKYGTKFVFGVSNFIGVVVNFVIPWFARKGAIYLILLRSIQGFCCGFSLPSIHNLVSKWIPPNERSKFVTAYTGNSIGAALTYPFCGFIIERWGWDNVFYACGILGTIWFLAWCFFVYDSPAEHPRVSHEEKEYIVSSLGETVSKVEIPTPWKSLLTYLPFWATVVAQIGANWGLFTVTLNGPAYIKFIHGWDIRLTGVLSGMPHLLRVLFAYFFSILGDYLIRNEKMKRTNVRKFATFWANGVQGAFMLGLAYSGCDKITAMVMLTLAVTVNGAMSTGALAGLVDISPNHSSILLGIVGTAVGLVGFCTPAVVGHFTFQNQTAVQWQKVFWVSAAILFISCTVYFIFANSVIAPWNASKEIPESENMVVKGKNNETINGEVSTEKEEIEKYSV
ncbi:sialin-like [Diorhabda carinulata]|uniref:sialin-like n=1 Tax=Diorhabda carinulata TaxID=1163345 RepID=UPI0025A231AF|nr:sialin-like [Diorhabda carinulata]